MQNFKQQLISICQELLTQKLNSLQEALNEVTEAGNNETKSTAGDKHETGRAMMQLEQEKLGKQVQEALNELENFNKIDFSIKSDKVVLGSLVETDKGLFLIATSIGKIDAEGRTVFVISNASPIGKEMMGISSAAKIVFNGQSYEIKNVI